jgi:hypothetical protein
VEEARQGKEGQVPDRGASLARVEAGSHGDGQLIEARLGARRVAEVLVRVPEVVEKGEARRAVVRRQGGRRGRESLERQLVQLDCLQDAPAARGSGCLYTSQMMTQGHIVQDDGSEEYTFIVKHPIVTVIRVLGRNGDGQQLVVQNKDALLCSLARRFAPRGST